jgi:phosphoribosylformimino-5-aminoimidazole carboxamide ribotide isomerase
VRCIFVLDILNGAVVHAQRGERSRYEPIAKFSRIVSTSEPVAVLQEIQPAEVYVADLNLLTGQGDNLPAILRISTRARTMADVAISSASHLDRLPASILPVLGTETASCSLIKQAAGMRGIVVSIDMIRRRVQSRDASLAAEEPLHLLSQLNGLDLAGVILLELDRVGTSSGLDRSFLEKASNACDHPLILGGGVRGEGDLFALEEMGYSGALVATALHSGAIPVSRVR